MVLIWIINYEQGYFFTLFDHEFLMKIKMFTNQTWAQPFCFVDVALCDIIGRYIIGKFGMKIIKVKKLLETMVRMTEGLLILSSNQIRKYK